jgi:RNA polymerase sigma-70 factor (ECF subfamily)
MTAEAAFLAQIRDGDADAWRDLIDAYEGRITAFARGRLSDSAAVDDVVQETFVGFLVSLPNYDASRGLETYLFSIAAHKITDHLRRQGRRPAVSLSTDESSAPGREPVDSARSAGSVVRSAERQGLEAEALAAALGEMLGKWREKGDFNRVACLELLFVRGMANKEVAAALAVSEQAVANYKFDCVARLREALKKRELSPEVFKELRG